MQWATVRLVDGSEHVGVVHTKDPETGSIVLLKQKSGDASSLLVAPVVIFGSAVRRVKLHGAEATEPSGAVYSLTPPRNRSAETEADVLGDAELVRRRRQRICEVLRRHRVPYTLHPPTSTAPSEEHAGDQGGLLVLGCLHAWPPFTSETCSCENEMVLGRYKELLSGLDL